MERTQDQTSVIHTKSSTIFCMRTKQERRTNNMCVCAQRIKRAKERKISIKCPGKSVVFLIFFIFVL